MENKVKIEMLISDAKILLDALKSRMQKISYLRTEQSFLLNRLSKNAPNYEYVKNNIKDLDEFYSHLLYMYTCVEMAINEVL